MARASKNIQGAVLKDVNGVDAVIVETGGAAIKCTQISGSNNTAVVWSVIKVS